MSSDLLSIERGATALDRHLRQKAAPRAIGESSRSGERPAPQPLAAKVEPEPYQLQALAGTDNGTTTSGRTPSRSRQRVFQRNPAVAVVLHIPEAAFPLRQLPLISNWRRYPKRSTTGQGSGHSTPGADGPTAGVLDTGDALRNVYKVTRARPVFREWGVSLPSACPRAFKEL